MRNHLIKLFSFISILIVCLFAIAAWAQGDVEEDFFTDKPSQSAPGTSDTPGVVNTPSAEPGVINTPSTPPPSRLKKTPAKPSTPKVKNTPSSDQEPRTTVESSPPPEPEGESHPLFDWSQHQGETFVKHPLAEKGLVEITKDRTYIYKIPTKEGTHTASLRIGFMDPTNLSNPNSPGDSFSNNYSRTGSATVLFDYEWLLLRTAVGRIGATAGSGLFFAQGNGHYVHPNIEPAGITPKETFSLAVFPINVGAIYRLRLWDRQLLVPYGTGGGTLFPFSEFRDDGQGPKFALSYGAYVAAGLGFDLTYFDKSSRIVLTRDYGISRMYLTGEFREIINLSNTYDFAGPLLNFGFSAEF